MERIDAFRTGKATLADDGQPVPDNVFNSLDDALAERPEAVVITNPTSLHLETALAAVQAGAHILVEKPVSHSVAGLDRLERVADKHKRSVFVAFNLRFHPTLLAVRQVIRSGHPLGQPLLARIHFGAFLPDWHPWEDYRNSYAARRSLGGGALLTHAHELDYTLWLMGSAERTVGLISTRNTLGTDVDESSAVIIRHVGGALSAITLSLAQKPAHRTIEIACEGGTIAADMLTGGWTIHQADGQVVEGKLPEGFQVDETYRIQAEQFVRACAGEPVDLATLAEARASLLIAETILEAE